jgi:hypothetical protein
MAKFFALTLLFSLAQPWNIPILESAAREVT